MVVFIVSEDCFLSQRVDYPGQSVSVIIPVPCGVPVPVGVAGPVVFFVVGVAFFAAVLVGGADVPQTVILFIGGDGAVSVGHFLRTVHTCYPFLFSAPAFALV